MRAIVSDASDVGPFQAEPTYLDSDGQLGSNAPDRTPGHAGDRLPRLLRAASSSAVAWCRRGGDGGRQPRCLQASPPPNRSLTYSAVRIRPAEKRPCLQPRAPPPPLDVNDGGWHMVAVSTHPDGTRGFSLYVDGAQVLGSAASPARLMQSGPGRDASLASPGLVLRMQLAAAGGAVW